MVVGTTDNVLYHGYIGSAGEGGAMKDLTRFDETTKIQMWEIDQVKRGLKTLDQVHLPEGTEVKERQYGREVVLPETGVGSGIALLGIGAGALGAFALTGLAINLVASVVWVMIFYELYGNPVWWIVYITGIAVLSGFAFYLLRVKRPVRMVFIIQICVAALGSTLGYLSGQDSLFKWCAIVIGAVAVADGFERLRQSQPKAD